MGSRRGKEGLLLAVFWVVAIALIGTAANRLILHGPLGGTLQKKETGRMLMELSVLFLWNLWWLCLAVKSREKRGLAIACLIPGWLLFLWGHRILIPLIGAGVWMGTLAGYGICINNCFLENIGRKKSCFSCLGEDPSGADHRKRSMDGPCMCSFSYRTWGNRALEKAGVAACSGDCGNFSVEK